MTDDFKRKTRAIVNFIHANGGKTIGEEDAERRRAKQSTRDGECANNGSPQDQ